MLELKTLMLLPATLGLFAALASASSADPRAGLDHAWGDFDGDGLVDLFLPGASAPGRLLANLGDGGFRDVTAEVGLDPDLVTQQASWSDFDADGDLDLLLLSGVAPARLFENLSGSFREATESAGLLHTGLDLAAEWTDFDDDTRPDLLITQADRLLLYRGVRQGSFQLVDFYGLAASASGAASTDSLGGSVPAPFAAPLNTPFGPELAKDAPAEAGRADVDSDAVAHQPQLPSGRGPVDPELAATAPPITNPVPFAPTRGSAKFPVCANTLHDAGGDGCLSASTTPTEGMLYPLSLDLFVAPDGDVGVGTLSPRGDLHVAGNGTGKAIISPTGLAGTEASELVLADSPNVTGGFRFVNTNDGGLRFLRIRGVNFFNDPYVSIMGGFGYFGLNVDVPLYRLHAFEESTKPQIVADGGKGQAEMRVLADKDGLGGTRQPRLSFQQYNKVVGRVGYWDGVSEMLVSNENSGTRLQLQGNGVIQVEDRNGGTKFVVNGGAGDAEVLIQAGVTSGGETFQPRLTLKQNAGSVEGRLGYYGGTNDLTLANQFGSANLQLTSTGEIHSRDNGGVATFVLDPEDGGGSTLRMYRDDGAETVAIASNVGATGSGFLRLRDAAGLNAVVLDGASGQITTRVLTVTGGADVAEPFDIAGETVLPGMVVSIDPARPGQLRLSAAAYDKTVAGIVSGAGGIAPGLMLSQEGTLAVGEHPVALTGRVYCLADASAGAIAPGDLLTSSALAGHAMKATDSARAFGAVIGKAMTSLESGTGLVLVLVSLQ